MSGRCRGTGISGCSIAADGTDRIAADVARADLARRGFSIGFVGEKSAKAR
jgi:hypothetical protein